MHPAPSQRWRQIAGAILLATAALLQATAAATPLRLQRVSDSVWFVQGEAALGTPANRNFISNAGFVVTPQGVVVIDALGAPALAEDLITEIRRITPAPIRHVIVTHYHADHIYGLQAFQAIGATIHAHRSAQAYLTADSAALRLQNSRSELAPWINSDTRLVGADHWLDGDTTLAFGGEVFHIRHAGPAHTAEDLVVLAEHAGVLFAGDLVFRGRIPFVGQADSRRWIEALDGLIALKPRTVVPGHGPMSSDPLADLALTRGYLVYLRSAMAEAAANLEPFEEAYARADWSRYAHLPLFGAANRMNAYNTYLLLEHQAPAGARP